MGRSNLSIPPTTDEDVDFDGPSHVSLWLKYFIFFLNFIIWVMSILIVAVGVWAYNEKRSSDAPQLKQNGDDAQVDVMDILSDVTVVLMIMGLILFSFAFFGCLGALRENITLLKIFVVLMVIVFVLELAGIVVLVVFADIIRTFVEKQFQKPLIEGYRDDLDKQNLIDYFQTTFQCCGIGQEGDSIGYKSWAKNKYFKCDDSNISSEKCSVPFSCCLPETKYVDGRLNGFCGKDTLSKSQYDITEQIYTRSCVTAILEKGRYYLNHVAAVVGATCLFQIFVIVAVMSLINQIRDQLDGIPHD